MSSNPYFSDTMVAYHRDNLTLPPTLMQQGDSVKNHAAFENAEIIGG